MWLVRQTRGDRTLVRVTVPALVAALVMAVLSALPAAAQAPPMRKHPGSFTGYAFDACDAPSQRVMGAWHQSSHFAGVGIYIAGLNRACAEQRHLDRTWVARQTAAGWRLLPIVVGRQAACAPRGYYKGARISDDPDDSYARARSQGRRAGTAGAAAARRLGITRGSVLWFDLEQFDVRKTRCRKSALHFVSGWTRELRAQRYRSGLYSSASTITMFDRALEWRDRPYRLPRFLWFAEWDGRARVSTDYLSRQGWWPHRRVHQYLGPHVERHGGARLEIDSNYLSTGRGSVPGRAVRPCGGVRVGFSAYPTLQRGAGGPYARAAKCLLQKAGHRPGPVGKKLGRRAHRAVVAFQRDLPRAPVTGQVGRRTWVALLSHGATPVLKFGSAGDAVRRAQRALNAAADSSLVIDGHFGTRDIANTLVYQRRQGLSATGVVNTATWRALQRGAARQYPRSAFARARLL